MNRLHIVFLPVLFVTSVYAQDLPKKQGCFKIQTVEHTYEYNERGSSKKSNKKDNPRHIYYLDSLGNTLEIIEYGKHHSGDLTLLNSVTENKFDKSGIIESIEYYTDDMDVKDQKLKPYYKMLYTYNKDNRLVEKKSLDFETGDLKMHFKYEYDSLGNGIKTEVSPKTYYQRTFDKKSRLISVKQFYKNKLNWEWTYTHTDTSRIGNFMAYNGSSSESETRIIDKVGLRRIEKMTFGKDYVTEDLIKVYYNKHGIINEVEYLEHDHDRVFKKKRVTEYLMEYKCSLTKGNIEKINAVILDELD